MANFQIMNVRIRIKQDTFTNWNSSSLIPLAGEMCLAIDTGELRYGDGIHPWSSLTSPGIYVKEADKLHNTCTILFATHPAGANPNEDHAIPTDVTGTFSFDGSQDVTTQLTLVNTTRTDAAANNTATEVITGITSDTKGRITATSRMNAVSSYTGSTDEGKLVKLGTDGKIDTNLVTSGADLVTNDKINAELLTDEITGVNASGSYVQATGTYIPKVVYYTDSTGQTIVNTSNFVSGETDVSSYYVAQNSTNTEADMNSTVVTTSENSITNIEYSQSYVLSSVNI